MGIIDTINNFTIDTLPHSILLEGERGSGYENVCKHISERFGLELVDLTGVEYFKEYVDKILYESNPTVYVVNILELNDLKYIKQNSLLKLFEEPNPFTFIVIYTENKNSVIETLVNRSYILHLDLFSKEELLTYVKDKSQKEYIMKICNTPGQVEVANNFDVKSMFNLINSILLKIPSASFTNSVSISNKINFSNELFKYDLFLFLRAFGISLVNYTGDHSFEYLRELNLVDQKIWLLQDKKSAFENFISNLWKISRSLQ